MNFLARGTRGLSSGSLAVCVISSMTFASLAQTNGWTDRTPTPTVRTLASGCVLEDKIFVTGGAVTETTLTAAVEVYDPALDAWTVKADLPALLWGHAICAYQGKIYVFGGFGPGMWSPATRHVYVYDPSSGEWTQKKDMPWDNAWGGIAVVGSTIYLLGGGSEACGAPVHTVKAYDPASETWTSKTDMPLARFGLSACVADGKIYAIGGGYQCNGNAAYKRVEVYDPMANTWTRKADMLTARIGLGACVLGGQIYATGGNSTGNRTTGANELYDIASDVWTRQSPLGHDRMALVLALVGHCLYAIGGTSYPANETFGFVEQFDVWQVSPPSITLKVARIAGPKLELQWQIESATPVSGVDLQGADAPQGPWRDFMLDAQSPGVIEMTNPASFYRVRVP